MAGEIETLDLIGRLPSNWRVARFGDVLDGGTRNGIYKAKEFHGRGAKVVNMGELFANPRLRDVPMKRVQLSDVELEKSCLNSGDLLFARRSLVAEGAGKCIVVVEVKEPTTFESSIIRARPNQKAADSLFLYYLFNSPYGAYVLLTIRRQVAVSGITGSDLVELPIPLPPLAEQKAIAAVLGALDDKIELNRRMNATLEAMARALFQSWFVDFDPVRAKLDGLQPAGLDAETAGLFPQTFQESMLGEIPHGWRIGTVGEIAANQRRGVTVDEIKPADAYIALEHMPRRSLALSTWDDADGLESNKTEFKRGEILFGKLRPYFHKVGVAPLNGVCSTDILVVSPKEPDWFGFLLGHITSVELVNHTDSASTGTKMPRTNWSDIARFEVVMPPQSVGAAFTKFVHPLIERIIANIHESRTLASLRDTLLPKLLSGELHLAT